MQRLNKANLLTWYDYSEAPAGLPMSQPYCQTGVLVWAVGERMSFFINQNMPLSVSPVPVIELFSVSDKLYQTPLLSYNPLELAATSGFYLYGTIIAPNVAEGFYHLRLSNGSIVHYSTQIFVTTTASANVISARYKFRNRFDKNNIPYTDAALSLFYQEFRLLTAYRTVEAETQKDIIIDIDSAAPREYNTQVRFRRSFFIRNLDTDMHDGVIDMLASSEIHINDSRYQSEGDYRIDGFKKNGLSSGEFTASEHSYLQYKRN